MSFLIMGNLFLQAALLSGPVIIYEYNFFFTKFVNVFVGKKLSKSKFNSVYL